MHAFDAATGKLRWTCNDHTGDIQQWYVVSAGDRLAVMHGSGSTRCPQCERAGVDPEGPGRTPARRPHVVVYTSSQAIELILQPAGVRTNWVVLRPSPSNRSPLRMPAFRYSLNR